MAEMFSVQMLVDSEFSSCIDLQAAQRSYGSVFFAYVPIIFQESKTKATLSPSQASSILVLHRIKSRR
jgi:hypothetical protein